MIKTKTRTTTTNNNRQDWQQQQWQQDNDNDNDANNNVTATKQQQQQWCNNDKAMVMAIVEMVPWQCDSDGNCSNDATAKKQWQNSMTWQQQWWCGGNSNGDDIDIGDAMGINNNNYKGKMMRMKRRLALGIKQHQQWPKTMTTMTKVHSTTIWPQQQWGQWQQTMTTRDKTTINSQQNKNDRRIKLLELLVYSIIATSFI